MADSLQDQLRALGLAKNKPRRESAGKAKGTQARKRAPAASKGAGKPSGGGEMSLGKAWALREKEEKARADTARRNKQEEDRKRREINNAIRAVVKKERLNRDDAEVPRHFMFRDRIRKLYVTPDQNQALADGAMGLVYLSGGYHLLPASALEAVRAIAADHVVDLDSGSGDDDEFPVPDDITW